MRLLRQIYEYARITWIDLGEERHDSQLVPGIIERIHKKFDALEIASSGLELTLAALPPAGAAEWVALNALLRRPW